MVESPDLGVPSLDQHIRSAGFARQIGEDQAIGSTLGRKREAAFFPSCDAVQLQKRFVGAENHFVATVTVPIVDLASHIVVEFLAPDRCAAPAPEDAGVEALRHHGAA